MFNPKLLVPQWKEHFYLIIILAFAAIVRFVGLDYGLPLWLVGDEPSHIFGALKMIELKTLLPVLHADEFVGTFHYTPYLSYLYILPFILVAGIKFLFFSGTFEQFKNYLIADPSVFFITARVISAVFGLATVYFVYAAARQMFQKKRIALLSALFLALSFLPVSYSHWARHWTAVTFFYTLGIYILANRGLTVSKRYLWVALLMGIGVGMNVQMMIFGVLVILWFFIFDYQPIVKLLRQKWFWQAGGIFFSLFGFAFVLWPRGYGYLLSVGNITSAGATKDLIGLVDFFGFYIANLIRIEPLFLLFATVGLLSMFLVERRKALVFASFFFFYLAIFYLFFGYVDRFILPLYPFLAVSSGYGLAQVADRISVRPLRLTIVVVVCVLLAIPILRFNYLLIKNDTREQAINWAVANVSADAKVAVLTPLMRLPTTPENLQEQENIDSASLRNVDRAEAKLGKQLEQKFNALNLYTVGDKIFFSGLSEYLWRNNYQYLIYSPAFAIAKGAPSLVGAPGEEALTFAGSENGVIGNERIPDGFGDGLKELFYSSSLGPEIKIIKLF